MSNIVIRQIKFQTEDFNHDCKAPRKKDFCLMDDVDILSVEMLKELRKRITYGIEKRLVAQYDAKKKVK